MEYIAISRAVGGPRESASRFCGTVVQCARHLRGIELRRSDVHSVRDAAESARWREMPMDKRAREERGKKRGEGHGGAG